MAVTTLATSFLTPTARLKTRLARSLDYKIRLEPTGTLREHPSDRQRQRGKLASELGNGPPDGINHTAGLGAASNSVILRAPAACVTMITTGPPPAAVEEIDLEDERDDEEEDDDEEEEEEEEEEDDGDDVGSADEPIGCLRFWVDLKETGPRPPGRWH